jgi:hypothetical protein
MKIACGTETEVAQARVSFRQYVEQETPEKFDSIQTHNPRLSLLSVVLHREADPAIVECHQAVIGDGNSVSVSTEVAEDVFRTGEGRLGIYDPVLAIKSIEKCSPEFWLGPFRGAAAQPELPSPIGLL